MEQLIKLATRLKQALFIALVCQLTACSMLPTDFEHEDSHAYTDTSQTRLGLLAKRHAVNQS